MPQQNTDTQYAIDRAIAESSNPRVVNTQERRTLLENLVGAGASPAGAVEALIKFGESNPTLLYEYSERFKQFEREGHDKMAITVLLGEFYTDEMSVRHYLEMHQTLRREFGLTFQEFYVVLKCGCVDMNEAKTYASLVNGIKASKPSCTTDDIIQGLRAYGVKISM